MATQWRRKSMAALTMLLALTLMLGIVTAVSAYADEEITLTPSTEETRIKFKYDDKWFYQGLVGTDNQGRHYYCIEAGKMTDRAIGSTTFVQNTVEARRMAWILSKYHDVDAETHAAISVIVQDNFGKMEDAWNGHRAALEEQHPNVIDLAEKLWNESADKVPAKAQVIRTETESPHSGAVEVAVMDSLGNPIAGVKYTVTLKGPAHFVGNGDNTFSGISEETAESLSWESDGEGDVTAEVSYDCEQLIEADSAQDMVALANSITQDGVSATFEVGRSIFQPLVSTRVTAKIIETGDSVSDEVTSKLESGQWDTGMKVLASGYYFDGIDADDLGKTIAPMEYETTAEFLERLASDGHKPVAYGRAFFEHPEQTIQVRAVTEIDGEKEYLAKQNSDFGTWVWAFERAVQDDNVKKYMEGDWTSSFLEPSETNLTRRSIEVSSQVTEQLVEIGSDLSDTITVSGFPEKHGSFAGNEKYEFGADLPYAQVSVWWSGDADDSSNHDAYEPSTEKVPDKEDANHELVAQWNVPAENGTYKVGAGQKDAEGKAITITAERSGWYVFVWSFGGDDRAAPVSSRYDDAQERTYATELEPELREEPEPEEELKQPEVTTTSKQLGKTGSAVLLLSGIGVSVLSVGIMMLAAIKRRSL